MKIFKRAGEKAQWVNWWSCKYEELSLKKSPEPIHVEQCAVPAYPYWKCEPRESWEVQGCLAWFTQPWADLGSDTPISDCHSMIWHVCTLACKHAWPCTHINTYIDTHTYTHTHWHTQNLKKINHPREERSVLPVFPVHTAQVFRCHETDAVLLWGTIFPTGEQLGRSLVSYPYFSLTYLLTRQFIVIQIS